MKTIVANWKMHLTIRESIALARGVLRSLQGEVSVPDVVLCPTFTALEGVHKAIARTRVVLGSQDVGTDRSGAQTGAVGTAQLEDVGAAYVLVGHSERRVRFHEDDALVAEKLSAVFLSGMTPILCVGDSRASRDAGTAERDVLFQLSSAIVASKLPKRPTLFVAYEPVWAISTNAGASVATPELAVAMHKAIRAKAKQLLGDGATVRVLYGGSVDANNAHGFLREPEVDGVLVGGASLKPHEMQGIIRAAEDVITAQAV